MAILDATSANFALDMRYTAFLHWQASLDATPVHTGTRLQELRDGYQIDWYGTDFTYAGPDANGLYHLTGGTVTGLEVRTLEGALLLALSGSSADAAVFGTPAQFNGLLLAGNDSITSSIGGAPLGDSLYGHDGDDTISGEWGNDMVSGGYGADTLLGGGGNDTLNGGGGADVLEGGAGNDTYYVQVGADVIVETAGGGNDLVYSRAVQFTMGDHVETGHILTDNTASLRGNAQDNLLFAGGGDNVIDGAGGVDTVSYEFAASGVTVNLGLGLPHATGGSGMDTLIAIENITGSLYADDLTGTPGHNVLRGVRGFDTLRGGNGDDTYYIGRDGGVVDEAASLGMDTVIAMASFRLGARTENLTLGDFAGRGWGNGLANQMLGNSSSNGLSGGAGADTISGGGGRDSLRGGAGDDELTGGDSGDYFWFDVPLDRAGVDLIRDFSQADFIVMDEDVFAGFGTTGSLRGTVLHDAAFHAGAAAEDADDRIIYDSGTGALYYDPDGTGAQAQVQFALVGVAVHPTLSARDFLVVV